MDDNESKYADFQTALSCAERLAALNWTDLAIETLRRAKPLAAGQDQEALLLCRLGEYATKHGDYDQAVQYLESGIAQLAHQPDSLELYAAYRTISWIYWRQGYLDRAASFVEGARAVIDAREHQGDAVTDKARASFLHLLALLAGARGDSAAAVRHYEQEIVLLERCGCPDRLGPVYGNLCGIYRIGGDYGRALEYQVKSNKVAEAAGDLLSVGIGCNNLGEIYHNLGDQQRAEAQYNRYLEINRTLGNSIGDSFALAGLGRLYAAQGAFTRAEAAFRQALVKDIQSHSKVREACILADMALMHCGADDAEQALLHVERAIGIYQQIGRPPSPWHQIIRARALWQAAAHDPDLGDEAFFILDRTVAQPMVIEDEQTLSAPEIALEAYLLLAKISQGKGDRRQAQYYIEKALLFVERIAHAVPVDLKAGFFTTPSVREVMALKEQLGVATDHGHGHGDT